MAGGRIVRVGSLPLTAVVAFAAKVRSNSSRIYFGRHANSCTSSRCIDRYDPFLV